MNLRRFAYVMCLCVVLFSGCSSPSIPQQSQQHRSGTTALLTILASQKSAIVSPSYIGMNIELTDLCAVLRTDKKYQRSYEQLFKNFGVGTLHIGGHSVDESLWRPDAKAACLIHPIVSKSLVKSLFAFANRIHWTVIWGLNFLAGEPQVNADEAKYVSSVGGNSLLGFTIGNEPELFAKHGARPTYWGYNDYVSEWNIDRKAVTASDPSARFFGPEACCQTKWFPSFLHDEVASGVLASASRHYYYYSGMHARNSNITAEKLLSPQSMNQFTLAARSWVADADQYKLPVDITEMNSISNGGIRGVSNTFGSSLWATDILFQSASLGIHQVDFQEVPDAAYALMDSKGIPQPIYNGLLFFHLATASAILLPSVLSSSANILGYVSRGLDNTLRVVLINNTSDQNIDVALSPGVIYRTMTTLKMQAASLKSTSGVTIGNVAIDSNGEMKLPSLPRTVLSGSQVTLSAPAASATLFTFSS